MQHFRGGASVIESVIVRCSLPLPALLTYTIYFPTLPPTSAQGWSQTCSGTRPPADTVLLLRLCRVFFSCLPLSWLGAFTTCDAMDGEATGAASSEDVSPQGKVFLTASRTRSPGCRDARAMVGEFLGWEASSALGTSLGSYTPARSAATAMGLGYSFTTFSSYNSAIPRKGNLSNFLIIILWNAKKLQQ